MLKNIITWRNMEDRWIGPKHSSWNVTCFGGICFRGSGCLGIETRAGPSARTGHVSMGGKFRGSCFEAHVLQHAVSKWWKRELGCHWSTTCSSVGLLQDPCCPSVETHAGFLKASNSLMTCHWNNVGALEAMALKLGEDLGSRPSRTLGGGARGPRHSPNKGLKYASSLLFDKDTLEMSGFCIWMVDVLLFSSQ